MIDKPTRPETMPMYFAGDNAYAYRIALEKIIEYAKSQPVNLDDLWDFGEIESLISLLKSCACGTDEYKKNDRQAMESFTECLNNIESGNNYE